MDELLSRITLNPEVRFGKACIRGTRIVVGDVLGWLAGGMTEAEILEDYPELEAGDMRACLVYAACLERGGLRFVF